MLWVGYFMGLVVFYLLTSWLPSILADSHLNAAQSASIAALLPFGGVIGTILCGPQYLCNYLSHKDVLTVTVTNTDSKQADLAISDATEWIVQACEHSH